MALTEEQKRKALLEYERKQKHVASSKKSGTTEPKMSKEEAKKSVQEMNEKVKQNAAKEKELMAGRTDPNLYKTDKKEEKKEDKKESKPSSKPAVNSAEVLSSNYVPPKQAAQQKIASSAVERILNPTAYSQPTNSTSSAPSFINPHQARSDSMARRAGVSQETLDNIQAQNNYGKDVFTESVQAGIANYLSNAVGTADILTSLTPAGMISNAINGRENSFWNQLNVPLQKWQEEKEADRQQAVINNGNKGADFYSQAVTTATQMVPDILISIATGGASKAVAAVDKAGDAIKGLGKLKNVKSLLSAKNVLPALRNSAVSTMQNPNFWNSFGQILYPEYEDALREGATENEAVTTAILSSFLQAKIEGGGVQKLPKMVSPTVRRAVYNFVKSAVGEGFEEVTQGIVSGITQKLIFDHDKQLYSNISGDDAIFNLPDAWSEWVMGTFMGGLMGAPGAMMSMGNALQQPTAPVTPNAPTDVNEQPPASPVSPTPPVAEPAPVVEPTPAVEVPPEVPNVAPEATQTTPEQKVSNLQKNKERLEKNIASLEGRTDPGAQTENVGAQNEKENAFANAARRIKQLQDDRYFVEVTLKNLEKQNPITAARDRVVWDEKLERINNEIESIIREVSPEALESGAQKQTKSVEAETVSNPTSNDEPLPDGEIQAAIDKLNKKKAEPTQNVQPVQEPQIEPQVEPKVEPKAKPKPAQKPAIEHDEKVEQLIPKEENIPSTPEPNQLVPEMANDESRADYRKRMEKEWKKSEHGEGETFKAWFDEHWKQLKDEGRVSKVGKKEYLKADTGAQTENVGAQNEQEGAFANVGDNIPLAKDENGNYILYHGASELYDDWNLDKTGGLINFAPEESAVRKYADDTRGGNYVADENMYAIPLYGGDVDDRRPEFYYYYQLDPKTKKLNAKGTYDIGEDGYAENFVPFKEGDERKNISFDELFWNKPSGFGGYENFKFLPPDSNIGKYAVSANRTLNLDDPANFERNLQLFKQIALDLNEKRGTTSGDTEEKIRWARNTVQKIYSEAKDSGDFKHAFWSTTKNARGNKFWKEYIIPEFKKYGYDSIYHNDDNHKTLVAFDPQKTELIEKRVLRTGEIVKPKIKVNSTNEAIKQTNIQTKNDNAQKQTKSVETETVSAQEQPKVEEKKQSVVEETKPKEQPKKEEPKSKATQADVLLQNMDALGSDVFDNQENIEQKSEAKTEKKKQLSVKEILNTALTETQIKRYSDRIDAINAYLENGENSLSAEQKENYYKVLEFVDSPTPENLIQKRNKWLKELYGDNPPAELMKDFATETKPKEQPAQPESVSQEEVDNAKKLLKELDYSNADISKMQPSEIVALAKSLESEAPDTAVGAHKAGENVVAHKAAEYGTYDAPEDSYTDYDNYLHRNTISEEDSKVLGTETTNYYGKDLPYSKAIVYLVKDESKFVEQNGKFYVDGKEIPKAAYDFAKFLEKNGVQYWNNKVDQIPKQWDEEHFVSKFAKTLAASKYGTDEGLKSLEKALEKGEFIYERKHNKDVLNRAKQYIKNHDLPDALAEWERFAHGRMALKPETIVDKVALGEILMEVAFEIGDKETGNAIKAELAPWLTGFGQGIQVVSALRKVGKDGEAPFSLTKSQGEYYVDNVLRGANIRYADKLHGKQIVLPEELRQEWIESLGTEKEADIAEKMFGYMANQIPASFFERYNTFRMWCMLSAPTTHFKNMASNLAMRGAVFVKDIYLTGFEKAYKKKHPEFVRTAAVFTNKADRKFAKTTFEEANSQYGGGGHKYSTYGLLSKRTNTYGGADYKWGKRLRQGVGKVIDFVINPTSRLLGVEDNIFKKWIYKDKVAQIMKANGWTEEYFKSDTVKAERNYEFAKQKAISQAYKGTFNDSNAISEFLTRWHEMPSDTIEQKIAKAAVGAFVEITFPFKKVTANIPVRALEYSPVGILAGIFQLSTDVKNGKVDPHEALEHIAAGASGMSIGVAGIILGLLGVAQLGDDENEDKLKENTGWQNFSLKINDDYYLAIDDLSPVATMLMSGVKLAEEMKEINALAKTEHDGADMLAAHLNSFAELVSFGWDSLLQLDFFGSVVDLLTSYSGQDDNSEVFEEKFQNVLESLVNSSMPNIVRKIMRFANEEYANAYYYDKNKQAEKWIQNIQGNAMLLIPDEKIEQLIYNNFGKEVNIPGYSDLAVRYDVWGRSINPDEKWVKFANNFISPGQITKEKITPVDTELEKVYKDTGATSIIPKQAPNSFSENNKTINMTAKQYSEFSKTLGQTRYKLLDDLFKSSYYKSLSDGNKVLAIEATYELAMQQSKDKVFGLAKDTYNNTHVARASKYNEAMELDGLSASAYIAHKGVYSGLGNTKTYPKNDRFYDYLIADKTTSSKDDVNLISAFIGKDFSKHKEVTPDYGEMLKIYEAEKYDEAGAEKADAVEQLAEDINDPTGLRAYALYSGTTAGKTYQNGKFKFGNAPKKVAAAEKLVSVAGWSGEDVAKAARCVTGLGDYLGKSRKTKANYITVLVEAGFTKEEANEFYNYYGW